LKGSVQQLTGVDCASASAAATAALLGAFEEKGAMKALAVLEGEEAPPAEEEEDLQPRGADEAQRKAARKRRLDTLSNVRWVLLTHASRINERHISALKEKARAAKPVRDV
jgi:hypothetical protein